MNLKYLFFTAFIFIRPLSSMGVFFENDFRHTAYHESGHAIAHLAWPEAGFLTSLTVVPSGNSAGRTRSAMIAKPTTFSCLYDWSSCGRDDSIAHIATYLAGWSAQRFAVARFGMACSFSDLGCEDDITKANKQVDEMLGALIARCKVKRALSRQTWMINGKVLRLECEGEGKKSFYASYGSEEYESCDKNTAAGVVRWACSSCADALICKHRDRLEKLAGALMREKTMNVDRVVRVLDARSVNELEERGMISRMDHDE
jgi:hypothetical protein